MKSKRSGILGVEFEEAERFKDAAA